MKRKEEFFKGCLLGGAIGDALGWPVEFLDYDDIKVKFGESGIQDLLCSKSGKAEITDDTQMTLFTAEGILRSETRGNQKGICDPASVVYFAYQRWLHTQGYPKKKEHEWIYDGCLLNVRDLHVRRAPGNACISALMSGRVGTMDEPINNSKGCGGVMRVSPVGLFYPKEKTFKTAVECAALTHGHPSGYLSAGALAFIISAIIAGADINEAVEDALVELKKYEKHEECYQLLQKARDLSNTNISSHHAISRLGEGWVGEEALAISVYCALKYKNNFKKAIITSVNHDGDSDSTGAITGSILGAYLGLNGLPQEWIEKIELKNDIIMVSEDLFSGYREENDWWNKYPGH